MTTYDPRSMPGGVGGEQARLEVQAAVMWSAERRLLEGWGLDHAAVIADLGCGTGALLHRLAGATSRAHLVGIDHHPSLLSVAAAAVTGERGGGTVRVTLLEGELDALPLAPGSVELAVLRFVAQHLPDPAAVFSEVRRILAPGGRIVVFDVDSALWGVAEPTDPVLAGLYSRSWSQQVPGRADRSIGRRLGRLLRAAGFVDPVTRVYAYDTDEHGIDAIAPLLDPIQLMPMVEEGIVTPAELADAIRRFRRWCQRPDAFALLLGVAASAVTPGGDAAATGGDQAI